jgi:hypothetical protein
MLLSMKDKCTAVDPLALCSWIFVKIFVVTHPWHATPSNRTGEKRSELELETLESTLESAYNLHYTVITHTTYSTKLRRV